MTDRHSVSVAAVVTNDDGQVLVIKRRDNGAWQLPGGVLELGETIEDGLRREVREETGIDVQPERLTGVYKNMNLGVVALVFRARWRTGTPAPTDESSEVTWWTPHQVEHDMAEAFAVRITDGLSDDLAPAVRHHDGVHLVG